MMDEENIKRSLSFPKFSRNQVSPESDFSSDLKNSSSLQEKEDNRFLTLLNECHIFRLSSPPTKDLEPPDVQESAIAHISDELQKSWNFPQDPQLIIRLVGSYEQESRSNSKLLFSIRDFLTELIQLTVKEELWMYIDGEDFSLFKSFGNLLQSITLPASDYNPAVFGVINSEKSYDFIDDSSELVKIINPKIKRYILTDPSMKQSIKKKGSCEDDAMFLKLTLLFDQLDLAAEIGQLWKLVDNNDYDACRMVISEALRLKRYNFVRYMIEQGMDPVHYIHEQDITKTFLLAVRREQRNNETKSIKNCFCLRNQSDDESHDISLFDSDKSVKKIGTSKKQENLIEMISQYCGQKRIYSEDYKVERLFKLAILKRKFELSELFWRYVKYPIGGALFACVLLDVMGKKEEKKIDMDIINVQKKKYETFAINTLNNTYAKYPEDAMILLSQNMPQWSDTSCIALALEMGNKEFISQKACQDLNERTWRNRLVTDTDEKNSQKSDPDDERGHVTFFMLLVSPRMKAFFDFIGLLVFLVIYGILLVSYLEANNFHPLEWVVWSFIVCYSLEWIRKIKSDSERSFKTLEVLKPLALFLFICGFFVKVGAYYDDSNPTWMEISRVMLSFDYVLFCLCILDFYYISEFLGPLLLTINIMTKILVRFFLIIVIFYVAFAIAAEAALYPVSQPNGKLFYFINKRPFWAIFGEFKFDEFNTSNDTCTNNASLYDAYEKPRCPTQTGIYYVPIIMAFYVVVINILLLNLLIASFNSAIKKTEKQSYNIWCFQKLQFTLKYQALLILPPPFVILWPLFLYLNSKEKNQTFTRKEIRDDYEAQKLKRIQTEQRDIILKDVEVKTAQSVAPNETEINCPHKDVGDIGIDLMLKLKNKVKNEFQDLRREVQEIKKAIQALGSNPDSTFSVDGEELDVGENNLSFDGQPTELNPDGSAASMMLDQPEANEEPGINLPSEETNSIDTDNSAESSDSEEVNEQPPITPNKKQPEHLISRYGNIIATRLSSEAEAILRKRKPTKTPRKYFACRTNYKYGVRWKIISVKKKTKLKSTDVPLSARSQKNVKKSVSDVVEPYLKLL
ncbi:hypothetical protein Btru_045442 [Bulinus truncatus]|nr:hypothetical protein Btru_045442 [Bulinus truncatus]